MPPKTAILGHVPPKVKVQPPNTSSRRKQTRGDAAYLALRRSIVVGELAPGDFVCERELAERLDMGKAPIRLAVQRLAGEGLLSVQPRRGIVVPSQSLQDLVELFDLRLLLESRVVRGLAGRMVASQFEGLRHCVQLLHAAMCAGDAVAAVERDFAFHRKLVDFQGNRLVASVLDRIFSGLFREAVMTMKRIVNDQADEISAAHEQIIRALEQADADGAEELLKMHLRLGEQFMLSRRTEL